MSSSAARAPRAWMVRAGAAGQWEEQALQGQLGIGWQVDMRGCQERGALRDRVVAAYPDKKPVVIGNWTSQLWNFAHEMQQGDLVVVPRKSGSFAVGRLSGAYAHRGGSYDGPWHTRPVHWFHTDLARDAVKPDLRNVLGSLLTVCELTRFDAAARIRELASTVTDPGDRNTAEEIRTLTNLAGLAREVHDRDPGDPFTMTVRQLIGLWNAGSRSTRLNETMRTELAEYGLSTSPPFTSGAIDTVIQILPVGEGPDANGRAAADEFVGQDIEDDTSPDSAFAHSLTIGNLPSARRVLTTVTPDDDLLTAQSHMVDGGFDQLPVVDEHSIIRGAVSWASIGRAAMRLDRQPTVREALVRTGPGAFVVTPRESLLDRIDDIYRDGFVLVSERGESLTGIVTAADLTDRFGQDLRPFVMLQEIEHRLRRVLTNCFTSRDLYQYAKNVSTEKLEQLEARKGEITADDLVFSDYERIFRNPDCWRRTQLRLKQELFLERLGDVRKIRNSVVHFHPDPISSTDFHTIERLLALLRTADPRD